MDVVIYGIDEGDPIWAEKLTASLRKYPGTQKGRKVYMKREPKHLSLVENCKTAIPSVNTHPAYSKALRIPVVCRIIISKCQISIRTDSRAAMTGNKNNAELLDTDHQLHIFVLNQL